MRHDTGAFVKAGVVLVTIMLCVAPVAAQTAQIVFDDFEDGNVDQWAGDTAQWSAQSSVVLEGSFSAQWDGSGGAGTIHRALNGTDDFTEPSYSFLVNTTQINTGGFGEFYRMESGCDSTGSACASTPIATRFNDGDSDGIYEFETESSSGFTSTEVPQFVADETYRIQFHNIDYTGETYNWTIYFAGNETEIANGSDSFLDSANSFDGFFISPRGHDMYFDFLVSGFANGEDTVETNLELEVDTWMPFNSTQDYRVILNETNTTTGNTNLTDVTGSATVVSNDTSIVSVDTNNTSLVSHNITGRTFVNASFDGETSENVNVTVGNRNMSNIGIMPPEQWINAFLEVDSTTGGHNIGSPMQWILAIVIIMYTGARMAKNPWVGIGSGLLSSILIWTLGFVGLGIVLNTVFVGLLLGVMIMRSRSSSGDTIVTVPGSKKR